MNKENKNKGHEKVEGKPFDSSKEKNTGMAVIAYILFFVPLLTDDKNDPFVKFHVRQGFLVFVSAVIGSILNMTIILMPIGILVLIGVLILAIIGIGNALNGKEEKLPIIGQFTDKVTF